MRYTLLVLFALAFSGYASAALFSAEGQDIRAEIQAAQGEGRALAVFLELPDCPACQEMKRRVFSDRRVEARFKRIYRTVRIDLVSASPVTDAKGEARAPQELAEQWGVFTAPAFVFFASDGTLEYRYTGTPLSNPDEFLRLGRFVSEAAYEKQPFSDYLRSSVKH